MFFSTLIALFSYLFGNPILQPNDEALTSRLLSSNLTNSIESLRTRYGIPGITLSIVTEDGDSSETLGFGMADTRGNPVNEQVSRRYSPLLCSFQRRHKIIMITDGVENDIELIRYRIEFQANHRSICWFTHTE